LTKTALLALQLVERTSKQLLLSTMVRLYHKDDGRSSRSRNMIDKYNKLNLFATDGRIGRSVYFFFSFILPALFFWIIAAIAGQISQLGDTGINLAYLLIALATLLALILLLRLTIQRTHDFNKTGWLALLVLAFPPIIILYWLVPGTKGLNGYGKPSSPLPSIFKWLIPLIFIALLAATAYVISQLNGTIFPLSLPASA